MLYVELFFAPVQQLSQVFDGYQQAVIGLGRLRGLMRTPTTTPQAGDPIVLDRLQGGIVFDDVHFAYESGKGEALRGVALRIEPGETVALVGQTGAGKSTVLKLLARFYDPTDGAVRIDGIDTRSLDLASFRQRLGVVPQEPHLFGATVRDAVAYGRPDATDAEVEAASRAVGAPPDGVPARPRLPAADRGARAQPVGRATSVAGPRPRRIGGPRHPAAGRGHGITGPGHGGTRPARNREPVPAAHRLSTAARAYAASPPVSTY
ncbi:bifunctional ABC multidrug transporter [Rhodococcus opacus M213]|uniref:Bifunctional ABC multidrug transporter n=1 Tax=Rhodococcus opacus M213 TaxID=1129896 RepID=K8Y036_RHOOP|nr:bifunctional ABC multidrug transporter [Rhodococcus opacus M213]